MSLNQIIVKITQIPLNHLKINCWVRSNFVIKRSFLLFNTLMMDNNPYKKVYLFESPWFLMSMHWELQSAKLHQFYFDTKRFIKSISRHFLTWKLFNNLKPNYLQALFIFVCHINVSTSEVFLGKVVLKICTKRTGQTHVKVRFQ